MKEKLEVYNCDHWSIVKSVERWKLKLIIQARTEELHLQ